MKLLRTLFVFGLVCSFAACTPSVPPTQPAALEYTHVYSHNVSALADAGGKSLPNHPVNFGWWDSTGTLRHFSDYQGKIVVLNLWATWCTWCVSEMPALQGLADDYKDSVVFIGLSVDDEGKVFPKVQGFADANNIRYQMVIDSSWHVFLSYPGTTSNSDIPQTYIFDRQGNYTRIIGAQSKQQFQSYIEKARLN